MVDNYKAKEAQKAKEAAQRRYNALLDKENEIQAKIDKHVEDTYRNYVDLYTTSEKMALAAPKQLELQKEIKEEYVAQLEVAKQLVDGDETLIKNLEDKLKAIVESIEGMEAFADSAKTATKQIEMASAAGEHLAERLLGINDRAVELGKNFLDAEGKVGGINKFLGKTYAHLTKSVTKAGVLGSVMLKAYEKLQKVGAALNQQMQKFGDVAFKGPIKAAIKFEDDIRLAGQDVGFSLEKLEANFRVRSREIADSLSTIGRPEVNKAFLELYKTSSQFSSANDKTSKSLQRMASQLTRNFNIAATTTGKIFDEMRLTFGKTDKEAMALAGGVTNLASRLKMDANRVAQDFLVTMDKLAVYSLPKVEQEFARLEAIQKRTGVATETLMGSMDKFSTFEGAAEASAGLNAALGLNISSMEMMETVTMEGPVAAFMKLKQRFDDTGISMQNLNFGQKRYVAGLLGMKVPELIKLMGTEFGDLQQAMEEAGGVDADFESVSAGLDKVTDDVTTSEQRIAKFTDVAATKMEGAAKIFMEVMEDLQRAMAEMPWATMVAGLVATVGGTITQLVGMWWLYARQARMAQAMAMGGGPGAVAPMGSMGRLGVAGLGVGVAVGGHYAAEAMGGKKWSESKAGALTTIGSNAAAGAMIGSVIPGVGTAIGAGIGGLVGLVQTFQSGQNSVSGDTPAMIHPGEQVTYPFSPGGAQTAAPVNLKEGARVSDAPSSTVQNLNLKVDLVLGNGLIISSEQKMINLAESAAAGYIEATLNIAT